MGANRFLLLWKSFNSFSDEEIYLNFNNMASMLKQNSF